MKLKVKNKKNLFSDYSLVLFILLSIFLIFIDIKNIINPSLIRSNTLDLIFSVNDFFKSNYPDLSKYKANFASNEELISENEFLKEKLEQSNLFKLKSEKLEIENNILRKELSLLPPALENYVFTKVIADTQTRYNKTIVITAGKNMNIQKGDAALTSKGLIGRVIEVYKKYSRVLLINDINSKIPVRVGKKNVKAIISGNNSDKIDLLYFKENTPINDSDLVYTSGDGGFFNPGIPVGVVKQDEESFYIVPLNDLSQIQYINIYINQFKNF